MTTVAPALTRGTCEGFGTIELAAGELRAAFAPSAGMAGVSLRHAGQELLHRRDGLAAYAERGAVMGVPILHPWANRLAGFEYAVGGRWVRLPDGPPLVRCEEHGLPIHGLLGGSRHWRVRSATTAGEVARLGADLAFDDRHPELLAAFPFPHTLSLDAALEPAGLTVTTTIVATGDVPVPVAFGFHPYLRLPGVERSRWEVELPARRHLFTDARGIPSGHHEDEHAARLRLGTRSFDDGFEAIADGAEFAVSGGGRRIAVTFLEGYPAAQVFSPPDAPFICFEPMTAPTNVLRSGHGLRCVRPGDEFRAAFRIGVGAWAAAQPSSAATRSPAAISLRTRTSTRP